MLTPTRLALIGTGRWGSVITKTLATLPECTLAYTATREWKSLTEKDDIDGVIIATPPATHAAIALRFIERGIPVFIEKPMTLSMEEAEALTAVSEKYATPVQVGHIHLYNPAFLKMQELAPSCGPIRLLIGEGANNGPYREDYSALWDWAPHDLSMMLALTGEKPMSVQAWGTATLRPGTTLWDRAEMKLLFPSGAIGFISSTWLAPEKRKRLTLIGEASTLVYDDVRAEQKLTLHSNMGPSVHGVTIARTEPEISHPSYSTALPLTEELKAFLGVITKKEKPAASGRDGLHVVELLTAAERSIALQGSVVEL